ncbi:cupin domain-containing protein [Thalassococcus sp. S3]|uniref:cupin domain-containing protein n=1 Tax=Thalassococcus sp. S3 TaxID=2017482 RepID=UPI0010240E37|nr:cupin domain-containing protein [Thalassococcus sp. S3]QBF33883.1 cupin [Thalassococcus sp. S3]
MRINADFSQRVVVRPDDYDWVHSPSNGVDRMMLDRIGDEVARATTLVRFAPGSTFDAHTHGGGEEFLVLDGVFSDETGDFPAGSYVRNPIGTSHAPHTKGGCTIFVKLHQFDPSDRAQFCVDTRSRDFSPGLVEGLSVLPLHDAINENVALVRWSPGTVFKRHAHWGGEEIFVLEGTFQDEYGDYPAGTWLRSPHLSEHTPFSEDGCLIYVKTGHLTASGAPQSAA